jgi:Integrase core domain
MKGCGRASSSGTETANSRATSTQSSAPKASVSSRHPCGRHGPRAHAERWIGSLRRECLDRLLIVGRRHLERVVHIYAAHYNEHRPHRSLGQQPPLAKPPIDEPAPSNDALRLDRLRRRDRLGGLLHEYELAAYSFDRRGRVSNRTNANGFFMTRYTNDRSKQPSLEHGSPPSLTTRRPTSRGRVCEPSRSYTGAGADYPSP